MGRRKCKCCKPACERCASTWQRSTFTVSGFTSSCSFKQWWWTYSPSGPPGTRVYFEGPDPRYFCSEFDLTAFNGTYVLEPYTNVGTNTLPGFFNACRGRYRSTIYPLLVEKSCSNTFWYDKINSGFLGAEDYAWDAYIQFDRNTFFSNGEQIGFFMTQYYSSSSRTTGMVKTWSWGFAFERLGNAACCATTSGTYGFTGFFWFDYGNIGGWPWGVGAAGGAKANFTPTVSVQREFRTAPSDCRYQRITESGDNLITTTNNYLILE